MQLVWIIKKKKLNKDATAARLGSLRIVWYATCRSYGVGTNGAVIVFNEGTTLSLQHWASSPVRMEQLAFTCLKYHTYQLPLPCSLQTSSAGERQWRKSRSGTAYPGSYRLEQYRGYCGADTNQNEIFAAEIKCPM